MIWMNEWILGLIIIIKGISCNSGVLQAKICYFYNSKKSNENTKLVCLIYI